MKEIFEWHFKTWEGPVVENATLGLQAGNQTCDPANLVQWFASWAVKAVVKSLAMIFVFIISDNSTWSNRYIQWIFCICISFIMYDSILLVEV